MPCLDKMAVSPYSKNNVTLECEKLITLIILRIDNKSSCSKEQLHVHIQIFFLKNILAYTQLMIIIKMFVLQRLLLNGSITA